MLCWLFPTENDHISSGRGGVAGCSSSYYRFISWATEKLMNCLSGRSLRVSNFEVKNNNNNCCLCLCQFALLAASVGRVCLYCFVCFFLGCGSSHESPQVT